MKPSESWKLLEKLLDPQLSPEERAALEAAAQNDPALSERAAVLQHLRDWRRWEPRRDTTLAQERVAARYRWAREGEATDREVTRLFPVFAGLALAAAIVVAVFNFHAFEEASGDSLDAVLGLPANTADNQLIAQL